MLEIKNVVKEYRPKKGKPVRAVDGISLKFPEKGMVFILGKSGSGKSTLLNLLGGLDSPDSGEIIVKGKSSKTFSQMEFDSYRNTYLGFIFQDYNILGDFNVAQNIGIALQLQGQKATEEKINEILHEVDLDGYGGRKPAELSGGQKQRVAIARALVKNPEIILADEPTGALDSKTGLQVFDTLKKLSEDKLIITITHDRDFAEMYGDRVIELKDGKVVSDIEKFTDAAREVSPGMTITDDKIIAIKQGYRLTQEDVELINSYLEKSEILLSADQKANGDLKRFARIGEGGRKESFRPTDESKIPSSGKNLFTPIKSRLPIKNKIIIGAGSLKNKPIRLIVTVILSVVAFTMFGLADTMAAYNKIKATEKSIEESGIKAAAVTQNVFYTEKIDDVEYSYYNRVKFSDSALEDFRQKTGMDFRPVFTAAEVPVFDYFLTNARNNFYLTTVGNLFVSDEAFFNNAGFTYEGKLPANENEVAVTKFFYDGVAAYGYKHGDKEMTAEEIKNPAAFLSKGPTVTIGQTEARITAVVDTKFDYDRYASLAADTSGESITDYLLQQEMQENVTYGFHGLFFVTKALFDKAIQESFFDRGTVLSFSSADFYTSFSTVLNAADAAAKGTAVYFGDKTSLAANECAIGIMGALQTLSQLDYTNEVNAMINDLYAYYYSKSGDYYVPEEEDPAIASEEEFSSYVQTKVLPYINARSSLLQRTLDTWIYLPSGSSATETVTIAGVYIDDDLTDSIVVGKEIEDLIKADAENRYSFILLNNPSKAQWKTLIKMHYEDDENAPVTYSLQNGAVSTIGMLNDIVETLSSVFLYVGIGFALFAALMMTNFISTSIVYKRREIGILRAVGAKGADVYGIFAIESLIIALINFVLSASVSAIVIAVIERSFRSEYHLSVSILNFGIRQIGLLLAISVGVALVASFVPTLRISRQKPVDAIKK